MTRGLVYGLLLTALCSVVWMHGYFRGERKLFEYQAKQATENVKIVTKRGDVVTVVETKYMPIIQKIYVKGETIEREVKVYVTKDDDAGCAVPVGFVREYNAAWSGEPAGSAAESDRGASGVPLSTVAEADAGNAKACLAYKVQRDGLIEFYRKQQAVK